MPGAAPPLMTKETEKAYRAAQNQIAQSSRNLHGTDYLEFLEELAGHIRILIDCYKDEHPEESE